MRTRRMPAFHDERGTLVVVDEGALDYVARRVFVVSGAPADAVRGEHIVPCRQTMVLTAGTAEVEVRDPAGHVATVTLAEAGDAVELEAGDHIRYRVPSPGSVTVFAEEPYRAERPVPSPPSGTDRVRASVLIPTHDHASTLPFTVRSALEQTVSDLEVLIVGDGVTEEVRIVASELVDADPRVRFLDLPKGPHRGEVNRDTAVKLARGACIVYCCDDDLLLPEHVADLCALLATADLVQSKNGVLDPEGAVHLVPGDLADPRFVAMLLDEARPFNFVGITGTAHTKSFYEAAGRPWETTPTGVFPDHHQWRRLLGAGARGATSRRMTALQFSTHRDGRADWTPEQRADEIAGWAERIRRPGAQELVDDMVGRAAWDHAAGLLPLESTHRWAAHERTLELEALAHELASARQQAEALAAEWTERLREQTERVREQTTRAEDAAARAAKAEAEAASLRSELENTRATLSWRITAPLRAVRRRTRRGPSDDS